MNTLIIRTNFTKHTAIYISKKLCRETKKSDRLPEICPKKVKN
ncbi:hypothetical protein BACCOP_02528 [Phocaeicola coprocola DSM 17136]|uniref:Uncharacterized protein n=1 Tax=Phocaeicola coprocola DSM 17136 TaxID=470145 RepID=B3JKU7_9BACT|nr:hypothetical protein BACCOP_02528 [Phocaeicola coprocola DSM 17136]